MRNDYKLLVKDDELRTFTSEKRLQIKKAKNSRWELNQRVTLLGIDSGKTETAIIRNIEELSDNEMLLTVECVVWDLIL